MTEDREPSFLPFEDRLERDPRAARKRWILTGFAAGVAIGGLVTALFFGNLGYDIRRSNMHEARLKGILVQTPTVYQVTEGLKEKAPLAEVVESEEDLHAAVERWGGEDRDEILEKARAWPQLRIYSAGDMMYFIFFDAEHVMRDYVYVSVR
ncbi:MAG: hypothetical protein ACRD21_24525 [Vicinamibacteria bacterium]